MLIELRDLPGIRLENLMNVSGMLADLNQEIALLTQIRDLLGQMATPAKPGPGRPKGSGKKADAASSSGPAPQRRPMSAEAREKIAAAQRKRWAAGKKVSAPAPKAAGAKTPKPPAKAAKKAVPAKKAAAKKVAGKSAPPKKAAKQAPAKKQPAAKAPPTETTTAGE